MDLDIMFGLEWNDCRLNDFITVYLPVVGYFFFFTCSDVIISALKLLSIPVWKLLSYNSLVYCHAQQAVSRSDYDNVIGALPYLKVDRNAK